MAAPLPNMSALPAGGPPAPPPAPEGAKLYIGSRQLKGAGPRYAPYPANAIIVDVTSAQSMGNANRVAFSPMHPIEGEPYVDPAGLEWYCFEEAWQAGKVWQDEDGNEVPHYLTWQKWFEKKRSGRPNRKLSAFFPRARKWTVVSAMFPERPGHRYGYVEGRKQVYVPRYEAWVKSRPVAMQTLEGIRTLLREQRRPVVVFDLDGPRNLAGEMETVRVTPEMLRERINDVRFPFGHGFVIAAMAAGIPSSEYCA